MSEIILSGEKDVRRSEDTVMRPIGEHTKYVQGFLRYLRAEGFPAPEVLPNDEMGREVLRYIEGEQVHPKGWTDEGLREVGKMVGWLHKLGREYVAEEGAVWKDWCLRELGGAKLIGHGDIAPWNVITRNGLPIALIDWEMAGPVDPMVELARVCWLFPQLFDDEIAVMHGLPGVEKRAEQVRIILDAYGVDEGVRRGFLERILEVAICETAHEAIDVNVGMESQGALWGFAWRTRSVYWIWRNRDALSRALL